MTFLAGKKKKTQPGQVGKHIYSPSLLWIWFQTSGPERVALEGHAARRDPGPRGGRLPGPRRSCRVQDALSRRRDNCRLTGQDGTREVEAGAAVPEEVAASTTAPPPREHISLWERPRGAEMAHATGGCRGGLQHRAAGTGPGGPLTGDVGVPPTREGVRGWSPSPSCHLHPPPSSAASCRPAGGRDQAAPSAAQPHAHAYLRECENGRALRGGRRRREETGCEERGSAAPPPLEPPGRLPGEGGRAGRPAPPPRLECPRGGCGRRPGLPCARPCLAAGERPGAERHGGVRRARWPARPRVAARHQACVPLCARRQGQGLPRGRALCSCV